MAHVPGKIGEIDRFSETRVVQLFFHHRGHGHAAIVVPRVEKALVRQGEYLVVHGTEKCGRAAALKIGAARTADQQAVAGERHAFIVEHKSHATGRMPGRGARLEAASAEFDALPRNQHAVGAGRATRARDANHGAGARAQCRGAGDVVRMHVGIEHRRKREFQVGNEGQVAPHVLEHRIDDQGLARGLVGQ